MPKCLDEMFDVFYDDLYTSTKGELGKKIAVLEENRQQLAEQLGAPSVDDCPALPPRSTSATTSTARSRTSSFSAAASPAGRRRWGSGRSSRFMI